MVRAVMPDCEDVPVDSTGVFSPHWLDAVDELRDEFRAAQPFPLVVVDEFLVPELADALLEEFPSPEAMPRSRDYVFGKKRELSSVESSGPAGRALWQALTGPTFAEFLSTLDGQELFVDPAFHGGGFHQGVDGSYLDLHVDFNVHPLHDDWLRTINVLLYLNPGWRPDYGGELLVKSAIEDEPRAIEPLHNRAVIMRTDDRTFHGYRRMTLPPGVTRRSIATYAYRTVAPGSVAPRTTGWAPEDAGWFKRGLARRYDTLVRVKGRLFGSGTARNR